MIRAPISLQWRWLLSLMSIGCLLVIYSLLAHRQKSINPKDTTIPTWTQLAQGIERMTGGMDHEDSWLYADSKSSLYRLILGVALGVAIAFVAGVAMGVCAPIEAMLGPPLAFAAQIPPTAALAVFFVMVGTDTEMFVAMIAFGIMPSLAQSVYLAVKEVPDELLFKAYTLGASNSELIWNIVCPYILPKAIDAVRLQVGPALVYLIAAEMVCADSGFGFRIRLEFRKLSMDVVYPYLALLGLFGFAANSALRVLQKKLCPWQNEA